MPRAAGQSDSREPLWPRDTDDRDLLGLTAQALLEGADAERVEARLRATPRTAGGAVGERQARAILEHAARLAGRAGGPRTTQSVDVSLALDAGPTILGRLPLPGPDGRHRIVSGFALNLHGLVEAWLSHALLAAWLAAGRVGARVGQADLPGPGEVLLAETVLAAPDATARVRIADPVGALRHAVAAAEAILAGPPAAFPRAWLAAWRESRQRGPLAACLDSDPGRAGKLLRTLRDRIEGGPKWSGERDKTWQAVFWRDADPDLRTVAEDGDALWAPILADVEIEVLR